jgi:hypothetical protein
MDCDNTQLISMLHKCVATQEAKFDVAIEHDNTDRADLHLVRVEVLNAVIDYLERNSVTALFSLSR